VHETFGGLGQLTTLLDRAAAGADAERITAEVKEGLEELLVDGSLELPDAARRPGAERYGRHLLYRSDRFGYVVVAMAWGPGQGTPLHDHAGIWCVEGVCEGRLEVTQFDLLDSAGDRFRFEPQEATVAGPGSAGRLIPPFEYHTIRNALPAATSTTLHVYGCDLESCSIFEPLPDSGWYRRVTRHLDYDN